jgi:ATP-binding cassette subfamily B (MDR/TAP) protein 1
VVNADQIVVIEAGSTAEVGQHRELLERQGIYSRLVAAQQLA